MLQNMTSRERVRAALAHRQPDRVPLDIGGANVSTIVEGAYEALKAYLGSHTPTVYMNRRARQVLVDEEIAVRLGSDTRPVYLAAPAGWQDIHHADGSITDEWRVVWRSAGGHYNPVISPLANAERADLARFPWPNADDPGRTKGLAERARWLHEHTGYAVVLSLPVAFVHVGQYLRGYDQFLMDLLSDVPLAEDLMERILEVYLRIITRALDAAGPYVDVVTFADDVAFQNQLMVRPSIYRQLIKPRHKRVMETIRAHTQAAVLYHCCGAVYPLLTDFLDLGIDALNPVQVSAQGMEDTARLKREFGAHLAFWGGIDTHHVLPHGTPDEVRRDVLRRINDLGEDGGYVVAAVHDIQDDVPPANILAMAEAVRESGAV